MRPSVTLDWQFINDDGWDTLQTAVAAAETQATLGSVAAAPACIRHEWLLGLMGILLLSVWAGASLLWPHINASDVRAQGEVQNIAETASRPYESLDKGASNPLISSNVLDQLRREVASSPLTANGAIPTIELAGDVAVVTVVITQTDGTDTLATYRQTRLYRQDATGWTETKPAANLWGEQRTLVTQYLRFEYHRRDTPAVEQAAHELNAMYSALRRDVGLAPPAGPLTIRVIPHLIAAGWRIEGQRLLVSSPLLVRLPNALSSAEALVQLLIDPFVTLAINEMVQQHTIQLQWQEVVSGAQSWLRTTYCAARRVERRICYQAVSQQPAHAALSLAGLTLAESDSFAWLGYREYGFDSVALIDYIVAGYGREQLPIFLAAFEEHATWNTLIPALFAVSAPEFEREWQVYLHEKAGC
jgi:hypothetical protein